MNTDAAFPFISDLNAHIAAFDADCKLIAAAEAACDRAGHTGFIDDLMAGDEFQGQTLQTAEGWDAADAVLMALSQRFPIAPVKTAEGWVANNVLSIA